MGIILFIALVLVFCMTVFGEAQIGILFILSLVSLLICIVTLSNKDEKLTTMGKYLFITSALTLTYSICEIFLHIDLVQMIFN